MKAILEFNLPEETEEFNMANQGWRWKAIVCDLDNYLRGRLKHEEMDEKSWAVVDSIRDELFKLKNDYEVWL